MVTRAFVQPAPAPSGHVAALVVPLRYDDGGDIPRGLHQARTYTVVLRPEPEGGVPAFPENVSYGDDETHALANDARLSI